MSEIKNEQVKISEEQKQDETNMEKEIDSLFLRIKNNLQKLTNLKAQNDENYGINFLNWVLEVTEKNLAIYNSKNNKDKQDQETFKKYRQYVYWVDFGKNIGSEFNDHHFAAVIRESHYTALVVPISTEKEDTPDWKIKEDLIIPIGELNLPFEKKPSYAMIHQMRAISKKRLDRFGSKKDGFFTIKLTDPQMSLIDEAIKNHCIKNDSSILQSAE